LGTPEEDTYSIVFASLKHPIRRKILRILQGGPECFSNLQKEFNIESSHLTYHLESLASLLLRTEDGKYGLSSLGDAATTMMKHIEDPAATSSHPRFPSTRGTSILKTLTFLLVCGLIASLAFNAAFLLRYTESDKTYGTLEKAFNGLDQAYTELNNTHNALNQAYDELNKRSSQLESAYSNLDETYLSLLGNVPSTEIRNIGTGVEYLSIQEAINAAENGSIVLVGAGVYHENVLINKSMTLLGASKDETIIDGSGNGDVIAITSDDVTLNGFTVRNSSNSLFGGVGIRLHHSTSSVVTDNVITLNGWAGIEMDDTSNATLSRNIISSTIGSTVGLIWGDAISLSSSSNNTISDNIVTNSAEFGINMHDSHGNQIIGNTLVGETISTASSTNNTFFHNNFVDYPGPELIDSPLSNNSWSVSGQGNYWDDYVGLDDGNNGRVAGDGVGDTNLPWHRVDSYPLISPLSPVQIVWENQAFPTLMISNSTISGLNFDQTGKRITFSVTGPSNTVGYFNLTIPASLLNGSWQILLDGVDTTSKADIGENATHTTIYLNYNHSAHSIEVIGTQVIPEYPSTTTLFLAMLPLTMPLVFFTRKKRALRPTSIVTS